MGYRSYTGAGSKPGPCIIRSSRGWKPGEAIQTFLLPQPQLPDLFSAKALRGKYSSLSRKEFIRLLADHGKELTRKELRLHIKAYHLVQKVRVDYFVREGK